MAAVTDKTTTAAATARMAAAASREGREEAATHTHTHGGGHTHPLVGEFLDVVLKTAIVLGVVLLLLVHKKLLGIIKRWKQTLSRSPTQASPAPTPTTPPRPPVPQRPTDHGSASTAEGTPADYFPASERRPATTTTTPTTRGTRPRTRPLRLFRRHRVGLNATRGGPFRRPLLASVTEPSSSTAASDNHKPWNTNPPKKIRKKGDGFVDLRRFTNEVVWAAIRLTVDTIRALLHEHGVDFPADRSMPLAVKCGQLAALLDRQDVDLLQVYQRQQQQQAEDKGRPATRDGTATRGAGEEGTADDVDEAAADDLIVV